MFIRRFYYDLMTGAELYCYVAKGSIKLFKPEVEAKNLELTNWGLFEWTTPDPEIEVAFANVDEEGNPREVIAYVEADELKFEYLPVEEPESLEDIIDILTGEVE